MTDINDMSFDELVPSQASTWQRTTWARTD